MNLPTAILLLVIGVALLVFGLSTTDSIPNAFSRLFAGHLTDRTMWMIVGGSVVGLVGLVGCYRSRRA